MRTGICTTDFPYALPAKELFRKAAALGFDSVQLAFSSVAECGFSVSDHIEIPGFVSESAIEAIVSASRETGVAIGAVNGTWNMAHPDREIREEGLRRMDGFLAAVAALGCPIATLCSGTRSRVHLWHEHVENASAGAWADMLLSMRHAAALAERHGVTLAIETEAANIIDTPEKARRIMDEVDSPRLKMILDCANLFHRSEAHPANVRPVIDRAFGYFGGDIALAHGKDILESDGISFCGAGFGIVDFPYMIASLRRAGFDGDFMLHGASCESEIPACLGHIRKCL